MTQKPNEVDRIKIMGRCLASMDQEQKIEWLFSCIRHLMGYLPWKLYVNCSFVNDFHVTNLLDFFERVKEHSIMLVITRDFERYGVFVDRYIQLMESLVKKEHKVDILRTRIFLEKQSEAEAGGDIEYKEYFEAEKILRGVRQIKQFFNAMLFALKSAKDLAYFSNNSNPVGKNYYPVLCIETLLSYPYSCYLDYSIFPESLEKIFLKSAFDYTGDSWDSSLDLSKS